MRISDGAVVATLRLDQGAPAARGIDSLSYAGSWARNTVVARARNGLAIFTVHDDSMHGVSIVATDLLRFDPVAFPGGVIEPRFVNGGATEVVAWAQQTDATGSVELDCRIPTRACTSFPMTGRSAQPVFNPSAPLEN